jgi:hypothetical protein
MRILIRLAVLALAAVGAKTLYDRFAPKAADLREPVSGVLDTAKGAARDVTDHAKVAASQVVDDAKARASEVRDEARAAVNDAPIGDTAVSASTS